MDLITMFWKLTKLKVCIWVKMILKLGVKKLQSAGLNCILNSPVKDGVIGIRAPVRVKVHKNGTWVRDWSPVLQPSTMHKRCILIITITIVITGSYNVDIFTLLGTQSKCHCGATTALIRQPQTHLHNRNQKYRTEFYGKGSDFSV